MSVTEADPDFDKAVRDALSKVRGYPRGALSFISGYTSQGTDERTRIIHAVAEAGLVEIDQTKPKRRRP